MIAVHAGAPAYQLTSGEIIALETMQENEQ
jgi:hypothetical protein